MGLRGGFYGNGMNPEIDEMQDEEFYEEMKQEFPEMFDECAPEILDEVPMEAMEIPVENIEEAVQPETLEMQPEVMPEGIQEAVPEHVEMPTEIEDYDDEPIHHEDFADSYAVRPTNKKEEMYRERGIDLNTEQGSEDLDAYWKYVLDHGVNKGNEVLNEIPVKEGTDRYPMPEPDEAISHAFGSKDYLDQHKNPFDMHHWKFKETLEKVKDIGITFSSLSHEEGRENMEKRYNEILEPLVEKKKAMLDGYSKHPQYFNKSKMFDEALPDLNNKIRQINEVWKKYSSWK